MNKSYKVLSMLVCFGFAISCQSQQRPNQNGERKGPPTIEQLFKDFDANEDGKLTQKEVKGPLKKNFVKIDLNEDGFLTEEELKKAPKPERKGPPNRN